MMVGSLMAQRSESFPPVPGQIHGGRDEDPDRQAGQDVDEKILNRCHGALVLYRGRADSGQGLLRVRSEHVDPPPGVVGDLADPHGLLFEGVHGLITVTADPFGIVGKRCA